MKLDGCHRSADRMTADRRRRDLLPVVPSVQSADDGVTWIQDAMPFNRQSLWRDPQLAVGRCRRRFQGEERLKSEVSEG